MGHDPNSLHGVLARHGFHGGGPMAGGGRFGPGRR
jgi:hypothetical protein